MDDENTIVSTDEANAEQEALTEAKADEIRDRVMSELGLSEDDDELVSKIVDRELSHKKKLSEAIGQKIKYRDQVKAAKPTQIQDKATTEKPSIDPDEIRKQTETTVRATFEQRDLDDMDYPDEIKAEIKRVAALQNISVRKAEKDGYIQFRIGQVTAADRVTEATITRSSKSTPMQSDKVPKFDVSTEAGRAEYQAWKQSRKG